MRVTVTGGTGFVGSHTVAALRRAGHDVRLLARTPERVADALGPVGVDAGAVDVVPGDVTDAASVARAVDGADAVVHAASVYSLDRRAAEAIERTNVEGTRIVLEAAHRAGARRIVHVSTLVALAGVRGARVGPDTPPFDAVGAYQRSKAASNRVARAMQHAGAPVRISYPGMVWGPHDPNFGETSILVRNALRGLFLVLPASTWPVCDVRDVAELHVALVERDTPGSRYLAPVHTLRERELMHAIAQATGRRLPVVPVPRTLALLVSRASDLAARATPFATPFPYEGTWFVAQRVRPDDESTRRDLGLQPRPLAETVSDTIRWLADVGYVSRRLAGRLAPS